MTIGLREPRTGSELVDEIGYMYKCDSFFKTHPLLGLFDRSVSDRAAEAIRRYAEELLPSVSKPLSEAEKQVYFKTDSEASIAILLWEFATGTGKEMRRFTDDDALTRALLNSPPTFEAILRFCQFNKGAKSSEELRSLDRVYGYSWGPDHTIAEERQRSGLQSDPEANSLLRKIDRGLAESYAKHRIAQERISTGNHAEFFLGGLVYSVEVYDANNIRIKFMNSTSKESLLLHMAMSVPRGLGQEVPLGTTSQEFDFKVPIPWYCISKD